MNELINAGSALELSDESEFATQVNEALKEYDSVLALARLPLANSPLVTPLLVLDDVSPTAEERGHALRLIIRWAVERLAPAHATYPLGTERPFDDPSWKDSRWWRYNILRHRYLEPLHPDDFVEGGRYTETLISLTGIPSTDTFFDERNRAIREVARWLRQQWLSQQASGELQRLALGEVYRPLEKHPTALQLLAIAATFDDVFSSQLLREIATEEHLFSVDTALTWLIQNRFFTSGDGGALLSLSAVLQRDLYVRQPPEMLKRRHRQVADWYLHQQNVITAVRHLQKGHRWQEAATILLAAADELVNELQSRELTALLQSFPIHALDDDHWREVQISLSDLLAATGATEDALAACRRALKVTKKSQQQAHIYRRMGKLYEMHSRVHALNYYQQAVELFDLNDPELVDLLKDRGWLYILSEEWDAAERDLNLALARTEAVAGQQRANIFDALSYLFGRRQQHATAIQYARQALTLREEMGEISRVADSLVNLGLLYMRMGEYDNARAVHLDGLRIYRQVDNRPKVASTLLNIGMAFHLDKRLNDAIANYRESLTLCQEIGLPLVESRAHSNLVEAYIDAEQNDHAKVHWQNGYLLAMNGGLPDEIRYYEELRTQFPFLEDATGEVAAVTAMPPASGFAHPHEAISPDEEIILEFTQKYRKVTASDLIEELHISRATATRRLAGLVEKGYLQAEGKGRGSYYRLAERESATQAMPPLPASPILSPNPFSPTDLSAEELRRLLANHRSELERRFAVEALGISIPPASVEPSSRLVVRFREELSLLRYFELRNQLSQILQRDIDLQLESAPGSILANREIIWLMDN